MWFETNEVLARFGKSPWLEKVTKLLRKASQSRREKPNREEAKYEVN